MHTNTIQLGKQQRQEETIKQSKKQHTTCMTHERATLVSTLQYLKRLVCFPLFGIKWKLKQRSSLGGKVLTQEGPFIAGRNNCVWGQTNPSWKGSITTEATSTRTLATSAHLITTPDECATEKRSCQPFLPSIIRTRKKNTHLQKAATGSISRRHSFTKTLSLVKMISHIKSNAYQFQVEDSGELAHWSARNCFAWEPISKCCADLPHLKARTSFSQFFASYSQTSTLRCNRETEATK